MQSSKIRNHHCNCSRIAYGASVTLPTSAEARRGGGWHGGGWHGGHGGWGWGRIWCWAWNQLAGRRCDGSLLGGYYGSNRYYRGRYDYGYPEYATDYRYAPDYAY